MKMKVLSLHTYHSSQCTLLQSERICMRIHNGNFDDDDTFCMVQSILEAEMASPFLLFPQH